MLLLTLLRHAKSAWDAPALTDFERPLAARGLEAAPRMGEHLARAASRPTLVIASTAVRAQETLRLVIERLPERPQVRSEQAAYLASPATLLALVRSAPAEVRHLMLVGHNPGLHELALELSGSGPPDALASLAAKLPTAGMVTIAFDATSWREIGPGRGRLVEFATPRQLAAAAAKGRVGRKR